LEGREARKRIERTFDRAAEDFDCARRLPWPSIEEMGSLEGKLVLDLGAGTGRNSRHLQELGASVVAADVSAGMLGVLRRKPGAGQGIQAVRCDAMSLPFQDSVFNAVAFVATLHHIPYSSGRRAAVVEVKRVNANGGMALITVWAPQELPRGARSAGGGCGGKGDICVPWAGKGERYYHIFDAEELRALLVEAGLSVAKLYREQVSSRGVGTNLVAVASK